MFQCCRLHCGLACLGKADAVGRAIRDNLEIIAELAEDILGRRRVIGIPQTNTHRLVPDVQPAEPDLVVTEFLSDGFGNAFQPFLNHNIHVDPQQKMRPALQVQAEIDFLARQNAAAFAVARQQVWCGIDHAKGGHDYDKGLFPGFKL